MSTSAPTGAAPLADFALRFPSSRRHLDAALDMLRRSCSPRRSATAPCSASSLRRADLSAGYGIAMDERVIEWPWVLANGVGGVTLDAGSALNHADVLASFAPRLSDLHIVTLEPEEQAFVRRASPTSSPTCATCRTATACFDTVVSVSTLEHVGMKNERYGVDGREAPRCPTASCAGRCSSSSASPSPGGTLLITVPYGRPDDFGWLRVFDRADGRADRRGRRARPSPPSRSTATPSTAGSSATSTPRPTPSTASTA